MKYRIWLRSSSIHSCLGFGTIATRPSSNSVCRLLQGTTLTCRISVDERSVCVRHTPNEYGQISYSYFLPGPEDTLATISELTNFEFFVWNSLQMVQVPNNMGAAQSKIHVDVDAPVAEVSEKASSDGFEQHSDVKMVSAVRRDSFAEGDVTMTLGDQSSALVLEKDFIETVNLAVLEANDNCWRGCQDSKTQSW